MNLETAGTAPSARSQVTSALRFADHLGPASVEWIRLCNEDGRLTFELHKGRRPQDAVLRLIYMRIREYRSARPVPIYEEFLAHFEDDLEEIVRGKRKRMVDTLLSESELLQDLRNVIFDKRTEFEFTTREAFLSYLRRRVAWSIATENRRSSAAMRRSELRVPLPTEGLGKAPGLGPATEVQMKELYADFARRVRRLEEHLRVPFEMYIERLPKEEIAGRLGITVNAVQKRIREACRRLGLP